MATLGVRETELRGAILLGLQRRDQSGSMEIHAETFQEVVESVGLTFGNEIVDRVMLNCRIDDRGVVRCVCLCLLLLLLLLFLRLLVVACVARRKKAAGTRQAGGAGSGWRALNAIVMWGGITCCADIRIGYGLIHASRHILGYLRVHRHRRSRGRRRIINL